MRISDWSSDVCSSDLGEAAGHGLTPEIGGYMNIPDLLENSVRTHTELRKRGVRHLIGGDYGFGWSPHGTQGRDIKSFVDLYGYSPAEALNCATRNGGLAMGYNEIGKASCRERGSTEVEIWVRS